jgi:ABC-type glycerol-3-phosphate transport system substrate-binding protein
MFNSVHRFRWLFRLFTTLTWVLLLVACAGRRSPTPTPSPAPPSPAPAAEQSAPAPNGAPSLNRQLVIWLPASSTLSTEPSAYDAAVGVLEDVFHQYEQSHPGVRVDAQVKAETGAAGLASFLRIAQQVAPSILPDLVLINTQQLWPLTDLGLVQPLSAAESSLIEPDALSDLYPFAVEAVTYRDQRIGIPYAADVVHGVYPVEERVDSDLAVPVTWTELLAAPQTFLFPGGNGEGFQPDHTLLQYAGAGGELNEDGLISSPEAVRDYLEFLAAGREQRLISEDSAHLGTFDAVWENFTNDPTGLASIQATNFLGNDGAGLAFVQVPTQSGELLTVAETWAFALLTQDEVQRQLALELVGLLLEPEVQGAWNRYSSRLPSRRTALAGWPQPETYRTFLDQQLTNALAIPNGRAFADFARRLQGAQAAVLRGELTPAEAGQSLGITP